jgi:hypothetical protein
MREEKAMLPKVFGDFAFQWRQTLCSLYNDNTFRTLAYAVTRIVALHLTIREIDTPCQATHSAIVLL